jgi:phosphoribosylglycinamide formyltransferase-1
VKLAVLASHGGTVLQAIIDACESGALDAQVVLVVSNNSASTALARAERHNIPAAHISTVTAGNEQARDARIAQEAQAAGADWIMLAGYMKPLTAPLLDAYADRIVNTHPALLPKHGGAGCYGRRVHEAVHRAGERETGATMHLVNAEYDRGRILQQVIVPVEAADTVDDIEDRVKRAERDLVVWTLQAISSGELP